MVRLLTVTALALASPPVEATVVRAMTLREKVQRAPVIVHGVVQRVDSAFTDDEARIRTTVALRVIESIKGGFSPGATVLFERGGGTVGQTWQTAPGLAHYEPGDEVVLFLEPLGATLVSIGIGIGTYTVDVEDIGRGPEPVVRHHPDVAALRYDGDGRPSRIEPLPPMRPEPLGRFLSQVRSFALISKNPTLKIPELPRPIPVASDRGI